MSPLKIERYYPEENEWQLLGELAPNSKPGSLSNNLPDGDREIYIFGCISNEESIIGRSVSGTDFGDAEERMIYRKAVSEIIATLHDGESHTLEVKTDISPLPRTVRFTHERE